MSSKPQVFIGCDHGAFALKEEMVTHLKSKGYSVEDVGIHDGAMKADYPDIALAVCGKVLSSGGAARGVVLCGTGIGIAIAANKLNGVRCAVCHDHYTALMARQHNDANVVAFGGRTTGPEVAKEILDVFLSTDFLGQHHVPRLEKIAAIEKSQSHQ